MTLSWCKDNENGFNANRDHEYGIPVLIGYINGTKGKYVIAQFGDVYGLRPYGQRDTKHIMFPTVEAAQVTAEILFTERT